MKQLHVSTPGIFSLTALGTCLYLAFFLMYMYMYGRSSHVEREVTTVEPWLSEAHRTGPF